MTRRPALADGDVQTLIDAVKEAKRREAEYEEAQRNLKESQDRIVDLIGGVDNMGAIRNGQVRIGHILTRLEGEDG